MRIINGSSGSGEGVPTGSIIISGKDMTEEGYGRLDAPLVLHKDNEPDLWDIYKEDGGDWVNADVNKFGTSFNFVFRIAEDIYMRINDDFTLDIFRNFDESDSVKVSLVDSSFLLTEFWGVLDDMLVFSRDNEYINIIDFDSSLENITDVANSFLIRNFDISTTSIKNQEVFLTKKGIFSFQVLTNIAQIPTDSRFGDINEVVFRDASIFQYPSDPVSEKHFTKNGFYLTRGIICDFETGVEKALFVTDIGISFNVFYQNEKDYISFKGEFFEVDIDFNYTEISIPGILSGDEISGYYKDFNFETVVFSSSRNFVDSQIINGVESNFTLVYAGPVGLGMGANQSITSKANLFSGGLTTMNSTSSVAECYNFKFVTEAPDIFTIDLVDQISTDKIAWIKLQQKGL